MGVIQKEKNEICTMESLFAFSKEENNKICLKLNELYNCVNSGLYFKAEIILKELSIKLQELSSLVENDNILLSSDLKDFLEGMMCSKIMCSNSDEYFDGGCGKCCGGIWECICAAICLSVCMENMGMENSATWNCCANIQEFICEFKWLQITYDCCTNC